MNIQILEEIGLTKTEIKIYLALLKLGQTTTTNIVKEAEIHASKVYEFLEKLIQKGLVSYVIKSNKKYFTASNPSFLKEFMREKENKIKEQEKEIDNLLPELKNIQLSGKEVIHSEIYEGLRGLKSVYEKILSTLSKGETQYIIGAPKVGNELLEGYLLDWHKKRLKKGIKCKLIYDTVAKEYGEVRAKMPLTEVKYMPKDINSPMWIEIWGDYVAIGHIKERNAILFLIHDKGIAKGYLDYFNLIWKLSKK
jgi:sugar-specific transcriptional regulator TrmB